MLEQIVAYIKREKWVFVSLFCHFIIQIIVSLLYYNPVDFILQFDAAKKISQGYMLYVDIGEITVDGIMLPRPQYPPLYLYTLGFVFWLVGPSLTTWQVAKIFLVGCNMFVGFLIYQISLIVLENYDNKNKISLVLLNWFLINPSTLSVIFSGFHDNFMLIFSLIAIYAFLKDKMFISGIFLGLSTLVKPIAVIFYFPSLIYLVKDKKYSVLSSWIIGGCVFLLVSLPFLLIAGEQYISDVLLIHTTRPDPNMSFYYTFVPTLYSTLIPFLLQVIGLIGLYFFYYTNTPASRADLFLQMASGISMLFLLFNRIVYPHYLPWFFLFFCFSVLSRMKNFPKLVKNDRIIVIGMLTGLALIYLGILGWALIWIFEGYSENVFLSVFCLLFYGGLIVSLIFDMISYRLFNIQSSSTWNSQ